MRLASLYDPATGCYRESTWSGAPAARARQEFLQNAHQAAFAAWLDCPPAQQLADLEAHIRDTGHEARLFCSTESYRPLVPSTAAGHERRLFFLGLEVILAVLRNQAGGGQIFRGWQVRRMIQCAWASNGSGRLTLRELSSSLEVPDQCLGRLFHRRTGLASRHYQRLLRIQRGAEILRNPALPIKEIAASLGYADRTNFDHEFRQALGVTPGRFRRGLLRRGPPDG